MAVNALDLIADIRISLDTKITADMSSPRDAINKTFTVDLDVGTGSGQANQYFADLRTLAGGANEELDLAGVLENRFGQTVTFANIKFIFIENTATTDSTLAVGGAAANAFINWVGNATDIVNIPGQGVFILGSNARDFDVTAGTGDKLKLENLDGVNSLSYNIIIVGVET
jgi:hypothetical protein